MPLGADDPVPGAVLAWRINCLSAERLGAALGDLTGETVERMDIALRAVLDL
ncbi:MAG TPA: hypothetical protein VGN37_29855 [Actinocatenispora sp.]